MIRDVSLTQIDVSVQALFAIVISRDVSAHWINASPGDSEGRPNACSILNDFVVLHPDVELLDFGNTKIFQMLRGLFQS